MFAFLLERCAHVYALAGKSWLSKCFLGSLPITTESTGVFNQGNAVFEVLTRKIKGQSSIIMCSVLLSEAKSDCAFPFSACETATEKATIFEFRFLHLPSLP